MVCLALAWSRSWACGGRKQHSAMEAVQRGSERLSALELMKNDIGAETVTRKRRFGLANLLERNRIGKYLKSRADAPRQTARSLVQRWRKRQRTYYPCTIPSP